MSNQVTINIGGQQVQIWESGRTKSWRLVHDSVKIVDLFEAEGLTQSKNIIFEGTRDACVAEAERLALEGIPDFVSEDVLKQIKAAYATSKPSVSELEYAVRVLTKIAPVDGIKEAIDDAIAEVGVKLADEGAIKEVVKP